MVFKNKILSKDQYINLYKQLLKPRMIENKMMIQLRQGKISKWFSGYGQEAISVGTALAMNPDESILTMHRNLGVFTTREVPLNRLFSQFQGKNNGFTQGRDRSFHFGSKEFNIFGMISHLGAQLGVADGIALGNVLKKEKKVTLVYSGDGGASEGDFHEALNVAAVWDLPVIFVIENNQWGLSTPSNEQYRCKQFIDKGLGYGIEAHQVDGNNIVDVFSKTKELAESIRKKPRPILLECMTFRIRGHEEASGTKYYPEGIQDEWSKKDPFDNFEKYLITENILKESETEKLKEDYLHYISSELKLTEKDDKVSFNVQKEISEIYAIHNFIKAKPSSNTSEIRMIDAISDGLKEALKKHSNLICMGQDIAEYGGAFKVTEGFYKEFGKDRIRNTPLCESAILGASLGLSAKGIKSMVEMQFADFVSCGFNQIVNNLAKINYRWGQNADVVIRMPTGGGVEAGPFHSQSNEAWFFHVPGLKLVYPSNPVDAKGLLISSFEDPNPVLFFEHKALYRSLKAEVPEGYYNLPIGKAAVANEGNDVSIITYGMGVHWAKDIVSEFDSSIEIIDLRSLLPLDTETIYKSVRKTGKVLILHEDTLTGGIGGEISALINEHCFEYLDAPVMRSASLDTPVPFSENLEKGFMESKNMKEKLSQLIQF